jgi:hypothetical protein
MVQLDVRTRSLQFLNLVLTYRGNERRLAISSDEFQVERIRPGWFDIDEDEVIGDVSPRQA